MIKELDYEGISRDICDELGVSKKQFVNSTNTSNTNILWARVIAYKIVCSYGLNKDECFEVLGFKETYVDNIDKVFTILSEMEEFRQVYAILKMSCYRKYRKDIHIQNK